MIVGVFVGFAVTAGAAGPPPGLGGTLRVDNSGGTNKGCNNARFTRIQDAIDAATKPDQMIEICAGTYAEQLVITKRIKLKGKGGNPVPVIKPTAMVANTTSARTGAPIAAGIVVAAQQVKLENLELDLSQHGLTDCNGPLLAGVFFRGASGSIKKSKIHGARLPVPCESGAAILLQGDGTPDRVDVMQNMIFDYQRAGIVVNERGMRATVRKNTVPGLGDTADQPQNGIQVGFGATATVMENVVQNNSKPSGSDCTFDAGNLIFQANSGVVQNNTFTGNTSGVIVTGSSNRIVHNTVDGLSGGIAEGLDGISVFGDRNNLSNNTIRNVSEVGIRLSGNANISNHNNVSGTHEATLCAATRALPGCSDVLAVCGVGLWVASGNSNVLTNNQLSNNDVGVRDDGSLTVQKPTPH
jgi:hypothetical protein